MNGEALLSGQREAARLGTGWTLSRAVSKEHPSDLNLTDFRAVSEEHGSDLNLTDFLAVDGGTTPNLNDPGFEALRPVFEACAAFAKGCFPVLNPSRPTLEGLRPVFEAFRSGTPLNFNGLALVGSLRERLAHRN